MTDILSDRTIRKCLDGYGVAATDGLAESIRTYISTLLVWNKKISLTTVVDSAEILRFHFGESLFAAPAVPISHGRLADVGSGAGFPGLPLAMLNPDLEVVLIESNLKKATFLSEIIRTLPIRNAKVWRGRAEDVPIDSEARFDFVTARALGHHENLLAWSKRALAIDGKVALWLGVDEASRISEALGYLWSRPSAIPNSQRRVILVGSQEKTLQ